MRMTDHGHPPARLSLRQCSHSILPNLVEHHDLQFLVRTSLCALSNAGEAKEVVALQ